ncbi:thiamine pyrophosphate protein central region [Streptomyces lincolnensis]|uniref:Thiamine pyrophosphate protein central region n=1 Tax=Streptomyces lincolnensis TaxID=1915 RepID=A0A1B1M3L7_STRLN|nr:thiamine pyrophosphate-binding protein [Streptomyces lincolnensis]ANS63240.1 thiamine pyrophosphate protein central region [Streptomyces lincolnensis]AXG52163.1 thiamine pyrophosphate protein central region [Streptomyces lincolnensis]QMV05138.1 thiamine pyrophosphate-binding protein [Streptomyces lincolnensis]
MKVAEAVGRALVDAGITQVFGVVGSGNFHLTNAMVAAGARFVAARHEGGAATMADAYARTSGTVAALSVHQGPGLTNAMTGLAEAAKSRTPLLVLAAEVTEPRSNFFVDQEALARAVGALPLRVTSAGDAVAEALTAVHRAVHERRTVLLNLPLPVQALDVPDGALDRAAPPPPRAAVEPTRADVTALTQALDRARRPVFVAGRGSRSPGARDAIEALADHHGALLATSAVANGLFHGNPWSLDVSGGFASPLTAELVRDSDLIVGWGCALNMWTMRHGQLIAPDATVAQIDDDPSALGAHRDVHLAVTGDVELTARRALETAGEPRRGRRTPDIAEAIAARVRWRDLAYDDTSTRDRIDPRTLSIALDDILPAERVVGVDSGNFMGHPSMYLSVPDENGFCFTQAFQSIGLGLATTIGAALARPDRLPVAALGDGGALMGAADLDTVRRLGLPLVAVVYNDDGYGAEVHHFGPDGHPLDTVEFPPTDIAAVARGYGFEAVTVRTRTDLKAVADWVAGPRSAPLLIDAKVVKDRGSWWLEEAFRGH